MLNTGIFEVSKPVFFLSEDKKFILGWGEKSLGDAVNVVIANSEVLKDVDTPLTSEEIGDVKQLTVNVSWVSKDKKDRPIWSGRIVKAE